MYEPLAALFTSAGQNKDGTLRFGIELVEGVPRAYIESIRSGERFYICLVWQESWSANPFARSKYIKGKLVYQAAPGEGFFARPFCIEDDHVSVPIGSGLRERRDAYRSASGGSGCRTRSSCTCAERYGLYA